MITIVLIVLAIVHCVGMVVWFVGYRDGERTALKTMHNFADRDPRHWYDEDDLPDYWAHRALYYNFQSRLAPVWEGVLVYRATAGIRAARQTRLDRLKTAHKYMEDK